MDRVCGTCSHCAKWTMYPGDWVGRCMGEKRSPHFGDWVDLVKDTCELWNESPFADEGTST